jgi:hypothetical protein
MGTCVGDPLLDGLLNWLVMMIVPLLLGFGGLPLEAQPGAVVKVLSVWWE